MSSNRKTNVAKKGDKQMQRNYSARRQAFSPHMPRSAFSNDLIGVAILAIAVAMAISLLVDTPAPVTQITGEALCHLCGVGALLAPISVGLFSLTFFVDGNRAVSGRVAMGLALIVVALLGALSLTYPGAEVKPDLVLNEGVLLERGGYVGGGIAWALLYSVGFGVGIVVIAVLIIVGTIVCGFSISGSVARVRARINMHAAQRRALHAHRQKDQFESWQAPRREIETRRRDADDSAMRPATQAQTTFIGSRKTSVLRRDIVPSDLSAPKGDTKVQPQFKAKRRLRADNTQQKRSLIRHLLTKLHRGEDSDGPAGFETTAKASYGTTVPGEADWEAHKKTSEQTYADIPIKPLAYSPTDTDRTGSVSGTDTFGSAPLSKEGPRSADSARDTKSTRKRTIPEFLNTQAQALDSLPTSQDVPQWSPEPLVRTTAGTKAQRTPSAAEPTQKKPAKERRPESRASIQESSQLSMRPGDVDGDYKLPPFSMLASNPHSAQSASSEEELISTMRRLQATLSEFGLSSKVVNYVSGPLVTTFQVEMGEGERVNRIMNLEDDIALTLATESVRIFAPIPGTSLVGIEIPNKYRENVCLGDVLPYAKGGPLEFAVGRDSEGKAVIADLAKMPHLLVAGATGSGKSVMINSLIMSMLMRDTPKQVRMILVDPKRVEFSGYNGLPHLYVPVVTEPRQAASALQWAVNEMERRLKVFEHAGARNISVYNEMCTAGKLAEIDNPPEPMPFMVIIIDELSDLMMVAGKDVEASIVRIAQLARAAGIHLVLATQRPSADVVTGLIKSNIDTRIALAVASNTDSRVIIDQTGAQRLLGNGDMLFKYRGHRTRRVLGCYVSDAEIEAIVDFVRAQGEPDYHKEILSQATPGTYSAAGLQADDDDDPLVWEAAQIVVDSGLGSTSGLQRRLKVGYARAGRIMDILEAKGIVGPPEGSKPRNVLLDEDGLEELRVQEERYREV